MNIKRRLAGAGFIMSIVITTLFLLAFLVPEGKAAEAIEHEEYKIHMHGAVQGSSGHIITFAWADLINKHSKWLRTTVSEEAAPAAAIPMLLRMPEKKKNTIIFAIEAQPQGWSLGKPPLTPKTPYTSWTIIARTINVPFGILTFDPKIKTLNDLEGKKFANLGRRSTASMAMDNILNYGAGLKGKVRIDYLDPFSGKDALLSGLVDAVLLPMATDAPHWIKPPFVTEIMASKKAYFADFNKAAMEKAFAKAPWPQFPLMNVPAGVYDPEQEGFWTFSSGNYYAADRELPEEVVYEALRIMYEQIDTFKDYHIMGKGMSREKMGTMALTDEHKHPGAIRFFKEKGIRYGIFEK